MHGLDQRCKGHSRGSLTMGDGAEIAVSAGPRRGETGKDGLSREGAAVGLAEAGFSGRSSVLTRRQLNSRSSRHKVEGKPQQIFDLCPLARSSPLLRRILRPGEQMASDKDARRRELGTLRRGGGP